MDLTVLGDGLLGEVLEEGEDLLVEAVTTGGSTAWHPGECGRFHGVP